MDCSDWLNFIVNSVCAIATVAAVLVALWQTKYSNHKRIKTIAKDAYIMIQNNDGTISNKAWMTISMEVVNIGNRTVNLVDWGVYFDKSFSLQILDVTGKTLPKTIGIEDSVKLAADLSGLKRSMRENHDKIKNTESIIKLYVSDSTGKQYYAKTNYTATQIMEMKESDTTVSVKE